jgi:hypothetical protein
MMGMVGRILKIPCKFQMGQSQGQEQCKDWCNQLGRICKFIKQDPNIQVGLERRRTNFNPCGLVDFISLSVGLWAYFYVSMVHAFGLF